MQVDPAGDIDSLNLYQYATWDPIMKKDPTGRFVPALAAGCAANPACRGFVVGAVVGGLANYQAQAAAGGPVSISELGYSAITSGLAGAAVAVGANPAVANGLAAGAASLATDITQGKVTDVKSGIESGTKAATMAGLGALGGKAGANLESTGKVLGSSLGAAASESIPAIGEPFADDAAKATAENVTDVSQEVQRLENQINQGIACAESGVVGCKR